jgi:uroporphyrinogen III methyltransferase/synthase
MADQSGKVYLVGAGPGAIAYLTVRGQQLLTQADVIIYDALVDTRLLDLAAPTCETVYVGKRGGQPGMKQPEIDRLLVDYGLQGKHVVRLKCGDPFIFGRSTSEIQALIAAGCDFEVVPGISAAMAAPLLAGIPLTDPVMSRCFTVLTAHDPDALDWETLAGSDTLVMLMGGQHLLMITQRLQEHGRSPQTPVAVIRWAGYTKQQVWVGTLETIVRETAGQSLSPCVITVGEVVALRPYLQPPVTQKAQPAMTLSPDQSSLEAGNWPPLAGHLSHLEPLLPLQDKTVLVTRAVGASSQFTRLLQQQGAIVLELPALEIGPPSSWVALDDAIAHLSEFDWLILTSTNGVDAFFDRLTVQRKDTRALAGLKIAVVGQKTAASLQQRGLQPDFVPPDFVADALVEHFPESDRLTELKILFPRVETGGREVLVQSFTAKGATVVEVAAYESRCPDEMPPTALAALQQGKIDVVTFASSKTVQCFRQMLARVYPDDQSQDMPSQVAALLATVCIASIGPQTSNACQEWLGRVDLEATEYTLEGLTRAIVRWTELADGEYEG